MDIGLGFMLNLFSGAAKMTYMVASAGKSIYVADKARGYISNLHKQCYETNVKNRGILLTKQYSGSLPMLKQETFLIEPSAEEVEIALLPAQKMGTLDNVIIAGGRKAIRNKTIATLVANALQNNLSAIVLHTDNYELSQLLRNNEIGYRINIVERGALSYNPFIKMNSFEISRMLFESIPEKYSVKFVARDLIRVACEIIIAQGLVPSPATLASCPLLELVRLLNKMIEKGKIAKYEGERLISDYTASQQEARSLFHFLNDLGSQLRGITNDNGANSCDIVTAIENSDAIMLNIGSNSNDLTMGLVMNNFKQLLDQGRQFVFIIDGIDLSKYKQLLELTLHNRSGFVLSHDDLFSSVGGDEKIFKAITGEAGKVIIHSTSSGFSCKQWSDYLSDYERHEPKDSINVGSQGIVGQNVNQGTTVDIKREARVPPEILNQLQGTQACIYDGYSNAILFADIL